MYFLLTFFEDNNSWYIQIFIQILFLLTQTTIFIKLADLPFFIKEKNTCQRIKKMEESRKVSDEVTKEAKNVKEEPIDEKKFSSTEEFVNKISIAFLNEETQSK